MQQRYYVAPDGAGLMATSGLLPPPEGWTELTAEEYEQRRQEAQQRAEEHAADWWAEHANP